MAPHKSQPISSLTESSSSPVSSEALLARNRMLSPKLILLAGLALVVYFSAPGHCASIDEQSSKADPSNLSKEEPQLSAASGLVKRSAPGGSAAYGHSIMRFGRAPHNIMHFGKRGGNYQGDLLDAYLDVANEADSSMESNPGTGTAAATVPEWILSNLLSGSKSSNPSLGSPSSSSVSSGAHVTRYLLVPVSVPANTAHYYQPAAAAQIAKASQLASAPVKKAKLTDETDNVFMHFG